MLFDRRGAADITEPAMRRFAEREVQVELARSAKPILRGGGVVDDRQPKKRDLGQIIADILDVSRIVTGKLRLELMPCELAPIVEAALDAVRPAADAKGIHLTSEIEWRGSVLGDPDRLQQVLWNLLVNGIKFTPPGGTVSVAVRRVATTAAITVIDSGEGISEELLPFIFDRFRQGDSSVTRPHGGLGLGLSIVRHIVELHGGKVQAWSGGAGQGASFSVYLPVHSTPERAAATS
jgi:signal transduction histidine kinase